MKPVIYAAIVAGSLYMYLMHFVTEDLTRVAYLGFMCIVFTITMQASPLAVVVGDHSPLYSLHLHRLSSLVNAY